MKIGFGISISKVYLPPSVIGITENEDENIWLWNDETDILWGDKTNITFITE